jgi:hypothetical protein
MAIQSSGAISFADLNTEIGNTSTTTISLGGAATSFGIDTDETNWSDSVAGIGIDEFYGLDISVNYGGSNSGGTT